MSPARAVQESYSPLKNFGDYKQFCGKKESVPDRRESIDASKYDDVSRQMDC